MEIDKIVEEIRTLRDRIYSLEHKIKFNYGWWAVQMSKHNPELYRETTDAELELREAQKSLDKLNLAMNRSPSLIKEG